MPYKDRNRGLENKRRDYQANRKRYLANKREYYTANRERIKSATKARQYQVRYGLTPEALQALVDAHVECQVCERPFDAERKPQIDHDHVTGKVRGLLCFQCNVGLGNFGEDALRLQRAIEYLVKHRN